MYTYYTTWTLLKGKPRQHGPYQEALDAVLHGYGSYFGQRQILISNIVARGTSCDTRQGS
jgi:hypothetical protein